ncbi:chemotaxis protein methyltransferase CheR [Fluviicoccus keumensis]|uniref:Chemotaxis protein methyltransferase CheR n=1 Tax=Fluviicoccus keumensis TaxID=1435465 RepID=A0A4V2G692_9GAMM|nr:CheR family methyltransferase [Fluviicoccus keumensis]RZU47736.1 chemotaxis protein methyltransferase CheR [Fluviicoccus keumensis]
MDMRLDESARISLVSPEHSGSLERNICRLLVSRAGICLMDHQIAGIREICAEAARALGYPSIDYYWQSLSSGGRPRDFDFLVAGLTVGESYFFRDTAQMEWLRDSLLPDLIEARRSLGKLELRIWSAGCAGGQEIYSLAMMLREMLPDYSDWHVHLLATDINTVALETAGKGFYRKWSFRVTPPSMIAKYFSATGDGFVLNDAIRQSVRWGNLNLADEVYPSAANGTANLDIILCRNVLLYIEPGIALGMLCRLAGCLAPEGVLLTGLSDPSPIRAGFQRGEAGDAVYWRRPSRVPALSGQGGRVPEGLGDGRWFG